MLTAPHPSPNVVGLSTQNDLPKVLWVRNVQLPTNVGGMSYVAGRLKICSSFIDKTNFIYST